MSRLCLIEDDPIMGESLVERFRLEGLETAWHRNAEAAELDLRHHDFAVVICDIRLPGLSGDELFERLHRSGITLPPFIFVTGYGDLERAVDLLKTGAADYITKPFEIDQLLNRVRRLIVGPGIVEKGRSALGVSPPMDHIQALVERVAPLDTTVLITGETGTGKEVVARLLHELSGRGDFVPVNCAALIESLAESELFGHERGAFTGAHQTHAGLFERASGGTLFLDEVGDMPAPLQAKLLRVLQERAVVRVGGRQLVPVDTRIVLATHQNLDDLVATGRFREDLFYRINVVQLRVPALRERPKDIPWLAHCFLKDCARREGGPPLQLSAEAEQALIEHDWPGNVRELRHTLERACIFCDGPRLRRADIFPSIPVDSTRSELEPTLETYLAGCERRYIERALEVNAGRIVQTAERLGISRKSLWERMRRFGLKRSGSDEE
ncbi:sigma-54-dependent transcriptional regulator [Halochromatium sp.]